MINAKLDETLNSNLILLIQLRIVNLPDSLGNFKFQSDSINTVYLEKPSTYEYTFKFQSDSINTEDTYRQFTGNKSLNSNLILLIPL